MLRIWKRRQGWPWLWLRMQLPYWRRSMQQSWHMVSKPPRIPAPSRCTCVSLPSRPSGWTLTPAAGLLPENGRRAGGSETHNRSKLEAQSSVNYLSLKSIQSRTRGMLTDRSIYRAFVLLFNCICWLTIFFFRKNDYRVNLSEIIVILLLKIFTL